MSKLTPQQQMFLNQFLHARAQTKGKLGGRQLAKVKSAYKDYCARRQKVLDSLNELERLPLGETIAKPHREELKRIGAMVNTASDLGDESVFAQAYKELEQVLSEAKADCEYRKSAVKSLKSDNKKFRALLKKVRDVGDSNKRTAAAIKLRDTASDWLKNHSPPDTADAWEVYQEAMRLAGGPGDDDYLLLAREAAAEVESLARAIDQADADLLFEVADSALDFTGQHARLSERLKKLRKAADQAGKKLAVTQFDRSALVLERLDLIINPVVPSTIEDSSTTEKVDDPSGDESTSEGDKTTGQNPESDTTTTTTPPPQPTNAELAAKRILETKGLLTEIEKSVGDAAKLDGDLRADEIDLKQKTKKSEGMMAEDFRILGNALADSGKALKAAQDAVAEVRKLVDLAEQNQATPGVWEKHLQDAAQQLLVATRQRDLCEVAQGRAEGSLLYIKRRASSMESYALRVNNIDDGLLTNVQAKIPVLEKCEAKTADRDEQHMLKHLVLTSALEPGKLSGLLDKASDAKSLRKVVSALIESPKLGTFAITNLFAQCMQILVDMENLFGTRPNAKESLPSEDSKKKLDRIVRLADRDMAQFTVPVIAFTDEEKDETGKAKPQQSIGVAIAGGGPIGMLAAIEARMAGASSVRVFEGRSDPYSRMNVLKIDPKAANRLKAAGVFDAIFPLGFDNEKANDEQKAKGLMPSVAPVKAIEEALEVRCNSLGIDLQRGLFLKDVKREPQGKTQLFFKGREDQPETCDLLIVATGAVVASAQKYADNVVLGDQLGIPFQKAAVKDFAAVALFDTDAPRPDAKDRKPLDGWSYEFKTEEVKYMVSQLSEDEYDFYTKNPRDLIQRVQDDGQSVVFAQRNPNANPKRTSTASTTATIDEAGLAAAAQKCWDDLLKEIGETNFSGSETARDQDESQVKKALASAVKGLKSRIEKMKSDALKKLPQGSTLPTDMEFKLSEADVETAVINALMLVLGVSRFPIELQQATRFASPNGAAVLVGDSAATPHPSTALGLNTGIFEMGAVRNLVQDLRRGDGTEEQRGEVLGKYEAEVQKRTDNMIFEGLKALLERGQSRVKKAWDNKLAGLLKGLVDKKELTDRGDRLNKAATALTIPEDKAKEDRDWKRHEEAVKQVRAMESALLDVIKQVGLLVQGGTVASDLLLAPIDEYLKKVSPSTTSSPPPTGTKDTGGTGDSTTSDSTNSGDSSTTTSETTGGEGTGDSKQDKQEGESSSGPKLPDPAPVEIASGLGANPTLYFTMNNLRQENYRVDSVDPGEPWAKVEQFCAYLAAHWLATKRTGSLSFSDLGSGQDAAIDALIRWGSKGGLNAQVNHAKQTIGGEEVILHEDLFNELKLGQRPEGTQIWFATDRHAQAARVGPKGIINVYDPNTGKVTPLDAANFEVYAQGSTVIVVK